MIRNLSSIVILALSIQVFAAGTSSASSIKGFYEWKNEKIQAAGNQISLTRVQIQKAQADLNKKTVEGLEKQLDQLKWNMEVAQDLSVTDYFVLYLSQQTQSDRFTQAAARLTTKEVAELMQAYANTLGSSPSEVVVRPSATPSIPSKISIQAIQYRDQIK
jgi:hypothetical protein